MSTELINVSFLGVDARSQSAYEFFFNSIKKVNCKLIEDYNKAQLCLVDMDVYNMKQEYQIIVKKHPDIFFLVSSLSEYKCKQENEFFVKKPVKREELQVLLNQVCQLISDQPVSDINQEKQPPTITVVKSIPKRNSGKVDLITKAVEKNISNNVVEIHKKHTTNMESKISAVNAGKLLTTENEQLFVGEQKDIDINNPEQIKQIFYAPKKFFQTVVDLACNKSRQYEQIIQVNILNNIFFFDYKEQMIYSTVGPGIIRPLCLIPYNKNATYTTKDNSFRTELYKYAEDNKKNIHPNKTSEKKSWTMESFMWLISLWTSRGRIPINTKLDQPVYLLQWPNLTRLEPIPHSVRIAALLYDQPYSLIEAAKQLGIEQRYVFAFYSACKSIGLANVSQRRSDKLFITEKSKQSKNKSILSKLLNKLINFSEKASVNNIA